MSEDHIDQPPKDIKFHGSRLPPVARFLLATSLLAGLGGRDQGVVTPPVSISATPITEQFYGEAEATRPAEEPAHFSASYGSIDELPVPVETLFQRAIDPALVTSASSGVTTYAFESPASDLGSSLSYVRSTDPRFGKGYTTYGHAITGGLASVVPGDVFTAVKNKLKRVRGITVTVIHGVLADGAETDYFLIRAGAMRASFESCLFSTPCNLDEVTDVFLEEIEGTRSVVVMQK